MIGRNYEHIFNLNRSLVIQFLQRNKTCTRAQISKALDLTPAAITKIVQELIGHNLIEEVGYFAGNKGRRSVGIKLRDDFRFIGAKISRRTYSVGVFDLNAQSYAYFKDAYNDDSLEEIIEKIKQKITEYIAAYKNVVSIGVAVPGPYLNQKSQIVLVTETKDWHPLNLQEEFEKSFDIPVTVMHDANSCALADWWFGDYDFSKTQTLVHMLIGSGVGAGVVINGKIFSGNDGLSGELGHVSLDVNGPKCKCGNYGCLEGYCSAIAVVKTAHSLLPMFPTSLLNAYKKITPSVIFDCVAKNDELSIKLIREAGKYIGYGVVNVINMYNPAIIVLSNQMVEDPTLILEEIYNVVEQRIPKPFQNTVKIVVSKYKDDPTLYGAAAAAIDYCLNNHASLIEK